MTTFAHRHSPSARLERAWIALPHKKYDIRAVDQFYAYCQAVSRTAKHRDEAHDRSHEATKRSIWAMLIAGGLLFYYLVERVAQAMTM
jgi:hypothetical protein